ncbi:MAG: hypothetical protein ABSE73_19555 [Planctomycetota bacterium]
MASFWSNRNLSGTRDALLVNGLAMLACCISIVLASILDPHDEAFGPGLGVALSATGVLVVWSLTLAVRAWRRGERSGWGWAVMVLGGPETVLLGAIAYLIRFVFSFSSPFDWAYDTGVIVFLPVGAIAYLGAAPVTWWRLRRAAKRDSSAGLRAGRDAGATTVRSHWKRGLIWFCAVAALLVALLLPCPLFLYCADFKCGAVWHRHRDHATWTWRRWVLENTPVFVAEPTAASLKLSSHRTAVELYFCTLWSGRVSKKRLLAEVNSTDPEAQDCAFQGLVCGDIQEAVAVADQIAQGSIAASSPNLRRDAGFVMGLRGTAERIRYFLAQAATQSPPHPDFMAGLLEFLVNRRELLPEVASFCRKDSPSREHALQVLAGMLPPKDLPGVWAEFLSDSDPLRREQAIKAVAFIGDANMQFASLVALLCRRLDPSVCQQMKNWLQRSYWVFLDCKTSDPALIKLVTPYLLTTLDCCDDDRRIRWLAAFNLSWLLYDGQGTLQEWSFFGSLLERQKRGDTAQATPEEQKMLESVRATSKKWLDEHN